MSDDNQENGLFDRLRQRDPRVAIAARDLHSLRHEKTIVMALLIQLFIAAFSSFLVLGLVSVYNTDAQTATVGVAGNATGPIEDVLEDETGSLDGTEYRTEADLLRDVNDGTLDAGIVANDRSDGRIVVTVLVPDKELKSTIVITQMKTLLERVEHEERKVRSASLNARVLDYPKDGTSNPYYTFTYTVLLPLLVFLPVFISGSIMVDSVTEEIERQTLELLEASPVSTTGIVDAKVAVASVLAPLQAGAWLFLLSVNGIRVASPGAVLAFVFAISILFVAVGSAIALALRERQRAQLVYSTAIIATFAAMTVLPQSPANIVARLAAGSANATTYAIVVSLLAVALTTYALVRRIVATSTGGQLTRLQSNA